MLIFNILDLSHNFQLQIYEKYFFIGFLLQKKSKFNTII